jgi:hypothetical protein
MSINLADVQSASVVMTDKGVLAVGPHPADSQERPLILIYLGDYVYKVAARQARKNKPAQVHHIAEINALREFVERLGDDVVCVVIDGDDDITDQLERLPHDLLAELPAGTQYAFAYEVQGPERFDPGEVNITEGVREALGARLGAVTQELLARHLSGDYGLAPKEPEAEGFKSDWELNDERVKASEEPYVMSVYEVDGKRIWIMSQYGKTYVMLPSEY